MPKIGKWCVVIVVAISEVRRCGRRTGNRLGVRAVDEGKLCVMGEETDRALEESVENGLLTGVVEGMNDGTAMMRGEGE